MAEEVYTSTDSTFCPGSKTTIVPILEQDYESKMIQSLVPIPTLRTKGPVQCKKKTLCPELEYVTSYLAHSFLTIRSTQHM